MLAQIGKRRAQLKMLDKRHKIKFLRRDYFKDFFVRYCSFCYLLLFVVCSVIHQVDTVCDPRAILRDFVRLGWATTSWQSAKIQKSLWCQITPVDCCSTSDKWPVTTHWLPQMTRAPLASAARVNSFLFFFKRAENSNNFYIEIDIHRNK